MLLGQGSNIKTNNIRHWIKNHKLSIIYFSFGHHIIRDNVIINPILKLNLIFQHVRDKPYIFDSVHRNVEILMNFYWTKTFLHFCFRITSASPDFNIRTNLTKIFSLCSKFLFQLIKLEVCGWWRWNWKTTQKNQLYSNHH